jgi:hypothetical protein
VANNEGATSDLNDTSMRYQGLASSGGGESVTSVQEVAAIADT